MAIALMRGQVDALERQMAALDDDIAETGGSRRMEETGRAVWSGRVMAHDGELIAEWDVTDPDNITGEWIRYDGIAGTAAFASEEDENYLCWHVADAPVSPATDYTLSTDTSGDIVIPCPKDWEDLSIFCTDEDGKLKFKKLKIKTEDPDVGLEFTNPDSQDDPDEPQLLQLKTTGGSAGDVYVCGEDGAASWQNLGIKLEQVGTNGIKVILLVGTTEIESEVLYGGECG